MPGRKEMHLNERIMGRGNFSSNCYPLEGPKGKVDSVISSLIRLIPLTTVKLKKHQGFKSKIEFDAHLFLG